MFTKSLCQHPFGWCTYGLCIALIVSLFWTGQALAQENLDAMAKRLIEVRADVEELQSELDIQREEHKGRMAFLSAQITELESSQEREELRIQQLQQELDDLRVKAQSAGADEDSLQPAVFTVIDLLRTTVEASIPFKRQERLSALQEVATELESGVSSPQRSINRLWAFVEDELRISRENAIYSQTIQLNGAPVLADVAKLGTIAMYFKTRDDQFGLARPASSGWSWQLAETGDAKEQIEALFDALRKQIRQGFFELPNALPAVSAAAAPMTSDDDGAES